MRLVIDNGSWQIWGCTASHVNNCSTPVTYLNMVANSKKGQNTYCCEDVTKIFDENNYRYSKPHVRGILVNFDDELQIWHKLFEKFNSEKIYKNCSITMSVPHILPGKVKEKLLELLFELFGFNAVCLMNSSQALESYYKNNNNIPDNFNVNSPVKMLVESGHSCTNIIPIFDGEVIKSGIRR